MTNPDLDRWNSRFDTDDFLFGESPNVILRDLVAPLPPGRALCVADGEGRNGVWLAEQGWEVVSLDFSPVAQAKAAALAARRGVSIRIETGDVHRWSYPADAFDLVADVFTQFSGPEDRPGKWAGMIRTTRPGGHVVVIGYTPRQLVHRTGGPSDPERLYTADMLRTAFKGLEILHLEERELELDEGPGHRGLSALVSMLARRPA